MTILTRLQQWEEEGVISAEQHRALAGLSRREPASVFLELNVLLYAGILAFIAGLGWTITTWSQQLGDMLVIAGLSAIVAACGWYCFSRAPGWQAGESTETGIVLDYVLYLGCLTWPLELAYLEKRFHLLSGAWDDYLLATAALFFFLAYRFDNRLVLSLALSSLAGWFGLSITHWTSRGDAHYRLYAMLYSGLIVAVGAVLKSRGLKPHFLGTYLNVAANVLFWALLSGVFQQNATALWAAALLLACCASVAWGLMQSQFSFVVYGAVYGYVGVSWMLLQNINSTTGALSYFAVSGIAMLVLLVRIARRFGRNA